MFSLSALAETERPRVTEPNYKGAARYSTEFLRQFTYDTNVTPHWIGKTDTFWYSYRTSAGTRYYRVNPNLGAKEPLFDHVKLASLLSETVQKPLDPAALTLSRMTNNVEGTKIKFVVDDFQYEYDLQAEKLAKLGKAPPAPPAQGRGGRGGGQLQQREQDEQQLREQQDQQRLDRQEDVQDQQRGQQVQQQEDGQRRGGRGNRGGQSGRGGDYRNFSPDRTAYVFAKNHNLFYVEVKKQDEIKPAAAKDDEKKDEAKKDGAKQEGETKSEEKKIQPQQADNKTQGKKDDGKKMRTAAPDPDAGAIQLTTDGVADYSFGGTNVDRKVRASVTWSTNSQAFHVMRRDSRVVKELYLVNSLATPRPSLEKYKYAMPGEEGARQSELSYFVRATKKLTQIKPKWNEESYSNIHFDKTSDELRFQRTDRLLRHVEFCSLNIASGEAKCLVTEGVENAYLTTQPVRYLDESDEMIWWSERSGWGHFYLYDRQGKPKNPITAGPYRATHIVEVDPTNRLLYFTATGREPGENLNLQHLYSARLDGTGLTLMDPGNGSHNSYLSPSRQFVVDNCSRVDLAPVSVLRRANGDQIMVLEKADLSRLAEAGWKMPETFVVKAADGVTDLFGNMWKPFNFDPSKKYPIIAHVYPGPQQEGTTHTFSAASGDQQLAQLGFIVIQVGHRGGTPTRSKAYATYGYFNLRDYGLADKKAAIEQLAARHPFIDIDRVGIYGHSGGGFMTAAAMLQKPYNEFFKVGVSSSGNHDNNIYNAPWSERYHGLKEVEVKDEKKGQATGATSVRTQTEGGETDAQQNQQDQGGQSDQAEEGSYTDEADYASRIEALDYLGLLESWEKEPQETQKAGGHIDDAKKDGEKKDDAKKSTEQEKKMKLEIHVPANAELAANLKGRLLLVHGDMDNNVHPANTMRLVDALIKANKRFDMLILPGKRHAYADYQPYFTQRMWEYFAEHLLGDYQPGADISEKAEKNARR